MPITNFDKILEHFFAERPAISITKIEEEAGIPRTTIKSCLYGFRKFPVKHKDNLIEVLRKYGWDDRELIINE